MTQSENRILVVDDEEDIVDFLSYNLKRKGYLVETASSGEECLKNIEKIKPDLILLDVMMPGISGIQACKKIKKNSDTRNIPIIMLTAKSTEKDIIRGLHSGADDYVVKPFSLNILFARIEAQLRRLEKSDSNMLNYKGLELDIDKREVRINGEPLSLTYSRFEILKLFMENPGIAFSRKDIVRKIKGDDYPVTERAIDVHIVEMRKMLGEFGKNIKTVRGVGYKFSDE